MITVLAANHRRKPLTSKTASRLRCQAAESEVRLVALITEINALASARSPGMSSSIHSEATNWSSLDSGL